MLKFTFDFNIPFLPGNMNYESKLDSFSFIMSVVVVSFLSKKLVT